MMRYAPNVQLSQHTKELMHMLINMVHAFKHTNTHISSDANSDSM